MKSFYLAASFPQRAEARKIAEMIPAVCTSRWLHGKHEEYGTEAEFAATDVDDVRSAEAIIVLTGDSRTRGGRHTELGIALALGKKCYIVGPREQVFHYHPEVIQCDSITELLHNLCVE